MSATATVILTAEDRTKAAFSSLKSNVEGVKSFLGGLKGQLLALAGVAGFGALALGAIESGDKIEKLSQRLGASTEALSQYKHVAELSNVEFDALAKGWQLMEKNVSMAAQNMGPAENALKELGLAAIDLKKLKPENQFEILADAFNRVQNSSDKTRLAMQIFGKAGAELIPIMQGGSEAIRAAREEADRLGLTLDQASATQMADAQDAMTRLKSAMQGVANILAIEFAPALAEVATWLAENLPAAVRTAIGVFTQLKNIVVSEVSAILSVLGKLFSVLGKIPGGLQQTFKDGADAADFLNKKLTTSVGDSQKQVDALNSKQKEHNATLQQTAKTFNELYNPALQASVGHKSRARAATEKLTEAEKEHKKLMEEGKRLTEEVRMPLEVYSDHLTKINQLLNEGAIGQETYNRALKKYQNELGDSGYMQDAYGNQIGLTENHVKRISDIFSDGFFALMNDGFDGMVKSFEQSLARMAMEAAKNEIARMLFGGAAGSMSSDGALFSSFFGGGGGGGGGILSSIVGGIGSFFGFGGFKASGGSVMAGRGYIVGEQGPEYFVPKQSGTIIPNNQLNTNGMSIVMHVNTPDANSFRRSSGQISAELGIAIQRAVRRNT